MAFFDAQAKREMLFDLPRTPDRPAAIAIADFREGPGDTLTVVSAVPGSFRPWGFGAIVKTGLRDDAGNGNVTLTAFDPGGRRSASTVAACPRPASIRSPRCTTGAPSKPTGASTWR